MELISEPAPYSELLARLISKIDEAIKLLSPKVAPEIRRVGIVSLTHVDLEDVPPGVSDLFSQVGSPLGGTTKSFNVTITNTLTETDTHTDGCIHHLVKNEARDELCTISLDWQRSFKNPRPFSISRRIMDEARTDALNYFERFAEGGLSDGIASNQ